MKKNKKHGDYQPSKIASIVRIMARLIKEDPTLLDDLDAERREDSLVRLKSAMKLAIPDLADKSKCPCCGESMQQYADTLDVNDALLLLNVAKLVRIRASTGMPFTGANKIRISSADIPHTQKCRTTKCSKLGLIAKAGNSEWSITRRGFEALAGKEVPKVRITFRGKILERPEVYTTFAQVFDEHNKKVQRSKAKRSDYRENYRDYNMLDWVVFAGYNEGKLV